MLACVSNQHGFMSGEVISHPRGLLRTRKPSEISQQPSHQIELSDPLGHLQQPLLVQVDRYVDIEQVENRC